MIKTNWITCLTVLFLINTVSFAQDRGIIEMIQSETNDAFGGYLNLPNKASLIRYCPEVKHQGQYQTSTVWATVYAARTIAEAVKYEWTDKEKITNEAFSPLFVYAQLKNATDNECHDGIQIYEALRLMETKGVAKLKDFDVLCASGMDIDESLTEKAKEYKLDGHRILFSSRSNFSEEKVIEVKKSLSEKEPVVIAMWLDRDTFGKTKDLMDLGNVSEDFPTKNPNKKDYHAMCVVGYDDNKYGGAFQIMNSWGAEWGENGFCWVKYDDFVRTVDQAYGLYTLSHEKRIALIIGNSYGLIPTFSKLRTSENDAKDFSRKLDSLGFNVVQCLNVGQREMEKVVKAFCREAKFYDVALVYFTGYGVMKDLQDYLIANDCDENTDFMKSICVDEIMEGLKRSTCPLKIGLFDIARNEAYRVRSVGIVDEMMENVKAVMGLSETVIVDTRKSNTRVKEHDGTMSSRSGKGEVRIFASEREGLAFDGMMSHGPFYEAIAYVLNTYPEISLDDFERKVAEYVYDRTNGLQKVTSEKTMIGDFAFTIVKQ